MDGNFLIVNVSFSSWMVKIRPLMDGNFGNSKLNFLPIALKSDHWWMEIMLPLQNTFQVLGLKSDHWWMEITWFVISIQMITMLKSDHWWMEIKYKYNLSILKNFVKIRPLMDGNQYTIYDGIESIRMLKSDHWWMEIFWF